MIESSWGGAGYAALLPPLLHLQPKLPKLDLLLPKLHSVENQGFVNEIKMAPTGFISEFKSSHLGKFHIKTIRIHWS